MYNIQPKIQRYNNFRGVDFTDGNVATSRSPEALNMWKNYKTLGKKVETRPEIALQLSMSNTIYGLFFYTISSITHWIIHVGTSLIDYNPNTNTQTVIKATGMNPRKSSAFVYNNIFFILDGINYLEYNGITCKAVEGVVPTIAIHNYNTNSHKTYQDRNLISDYVNELFFADGVQTEYQVSSKDISDITVYVNDVQKEITTDYTVDTTNGIITFTTAPEQDIDSANVVIKYKKVISGAKNKIFKCTLSTIFDNRVFFSGNQDYPNLLMWCGLNDPRYISDMYYATDGDLAPIKALVPGNNALWVFKEPSQSNTTVFYHVPGLQYNDVLEESIKTYAEAHSSITTGCKATGINFNDDIVFFSDRGMEGISSDITTEQVLGHRSTLVDRKLLNESNYNLMELAEWEGYLLVIIDDKVYLADSRQKVNNADHIEYEWFYWELSKKIKRAATYEGILYLCSEAENVYNEQGYKKYTDGENIYWYDTENEKLYDDEGTESQVSVGTLTEVFTSGIYTLTDNTENRTISSYWTTPEDDFNYPQYLKTTNKRGFKSDVVGAKIKVDVKTDNNEFETLGTFENTKGYIVAKIKEKKWNKIQLKFSNDKPFGIYEINLEAYVGSYVKR